MINIDLMEAMERLDAAYPMHHRGIKYQCENGVREWVAGVEIGEQYRCGFGNTAMAAVDALIAKTGNPDDQKLARIAELEAELETLKAQL